MKKTALILTGLLVLGMAFLPAGSADEVSGTYAISATPGVSLTFCPGTDEPANFCTGGFIFSADSYESEPTQAAIADASGGAVDFTVCQDHDANIQCGEAAEPSVMGCGTSADLSESEVPFTAEHATAVFVRMWSPDCPDTVATSGTITLTF